jgi:type III restriction enzyme
MARKRQVSNEQLSLLEAKVTTAPCVTGIRQKVREWVDGGYKNITDTTKILLNHWFHTDHRLSNGQIFRYHYFQREAVETLIYLYEVAKLRTHKELIEKFATRSHLRLLQYDKFTRHCVKMATGSGKTKVMSLAIAWHYFNSQTRPGDEFASTFLLVAPNIIVFERLRSDFEGARIFLTDPIIPNEPRIYWDFQCYVRGDSERASSLGALYLTNIQQFYARSNTNAEEPDVMTAVLGQKPPARDMSTVDFDERIAKRGTPLMVLNDEAHHVHDEESEWNKTIRTLHESTQKGVKAQLDFSATPRHSRGQIFSWTIYDYSLKQAILDNVVKRPLKGITSGIKEQPSDIASVRYQSYLTAGVERWREYRDQLKEVGKNPIFFVMLNSTQEADDVGEPQPIAKFVTKRTIR